MRGGEGDTVPVDLIEVDSPDALLPPGPSGLSGQDVGAPAPDGSSAVVTAAHRRRRRVLRAVSAGVVLALAATGGVLTMLDARRAETRRDALAERGWPLVDLAAPLEEVWRLSGGGWPMVISADVLGIQAWLPESGQVDWRAVDADTGEVLWQREDLGDGWCSPWNPEWSEPLAGAGAAAAYAGWPGAGGVADPTVLVCPAEPGFGGELPAADAMSTVSVLDLRNGREIGTVAAPGALVSFEPVEEGLLVTTVTGDGVVHVTRSDLIGGRTVWSVSTSAIGVDDEGAYVGGWPTVRDGVLMLLSPDGELIEARDVETGAPVTADVEVPAPSFARMDLPDGGRAEVIYAEIGSDGAYTSVVGDPIIVVTGPDGTERFTVRGELFTPWFNDGSMPDRIVVTQEGEGGTRSLVALDVVTGAELWTAPAPWSSSLLQVDGLVVSGSGYLAATDLRTGEQLWEHRAAVEGVTSPLTDGSRIAVPITEDGEGFLAAFDIRSGAEQWRVPALEGVQVLAAVGDGVLLGNESELVFLKVGAAD